MAEETFTLKLENTSYTQLRKDDEKTKPIRKAKEKEKTHNINYGTHQNQYGTCGYIFSRRKSITSFTLQKEKSRNTGGDESSLVITKSNGDS